MLALLNSRDSLGGLSSEPPAPPAAVELIVGDLRVSNCDDFNVDDIVLGSGDSRDR